MIFIEGLRLHFEASYPSQRRFHAGDRIDWGISVVGTWPSRPKFSSLKGSRVVGMSRTMMPQQSSMEQKDSRS